MLQAIETRLFTAIDNYFGAKGALKAEDVKRVIRCVMFFRPAKVDLFSPETAHDSIDMPVVLGRAILIGTAAAFLPSLMGRAFPSLVLPKMPLGVNVKYVSGLGVGFIISLFEYLRARNSLADTETRHVWGLLS